MDIVLGNYKGLKANIPYIAYTEDDVNSQIATLLSGNPVREQKTGPNRASFLHAIHNMPLS